MPGEFYVEGKLEKLNLQTVLDLLLKLQRSSQSGWKLMAGDYAPVYEESNATAYIFAGGKIDLEGPRVIVMSGWVKRRVFAAFVLTVR